MHNFFKKSKNQLTNFIHIKFKNCRTMKKNIVSISFDENYEEKKFKDNEQLTLITDRMPNSHCSGVQYCTVLAGAGSTLYS